MRHKHGQESTYNETTLCGRTGRQSPNKKEPPRTDRGVLSVRDRLRGRPRQSCSRNGADNRRHSPSSPLDHSPKRVKQRYSSVRKGNKMPADRSILSVCDCSRAFILTRYHAEWRGFIWVSSWGTAIPHVWNNCRSGTLRDGRHPYQDRRWEAYRTRER